MCNGAKRKFIQNSSEPCFHKAVRPGVMALSLPLRPVSVFVFQEKHFVIGWFRQNSMLRLQVD